MFKKLREKTFYIAAGVCLWLAVGNWVEYKLPLDSFRILHATVRDAEARSYNCSAKYTVYLVTRYWYQYLLSFGNPYSIYYLENERGELLYSIGHIKAANWGYAVFSGIMFAVCLLFLFVDLQIQKEKKRKPPVVVQVYEDKVTWE
jgi:hypothetical protein